MPSEMESELLAAQEPIATKPPVAGLYNLVKAWAQLPPPEAYEKLSLALKRTESVNAKNNKGSTGLHAAGYLRRWDLAKIMLEAGADPLIKNLAGHDFYVQLVTAPKSPWRELLASRPDLVAKQEEFLAARKKQSSELREAQKGKSADKHKKQDKQEKSDRQEKPQRRKIEACLDDESIEKLSHLEIISLNGEMMNHDKAWHEAKDAAAEGQLELLQAWIKSNQLHPAYDPEGRTLIQCIASQDNREVLSVSLNAGLSPKTPNRKGDTALHDVARIKRDDLAQLLLNSGADPSYRNQVGETALSIACLHNDVDMVERLMAFGASPSEKMENGESLIAVVERLGYFEIADILSAELEHQPSMAVIQKNQQPQFNASHPGNSIGAGKPRGPERDKGNKSLGKTKSGKKHVGKKSVARPAANRSASESSQPSSTGSFSNAISNGAGTAKSKTTRSGQKNVAYKGGKRAGSKRASPMIANLSPMKEVDEFATYKGPKNNVPAPVIIVKKSRSLKPDGIPPEALGVSRIGTLASAKSIPSVQPEAKSMQEQVIRRKPRVG